MPLLPWLSQYWGKGGEAKGTSVRGGAALIKCQYYGLQQPGDFDCFSDVFDVEENPSCSTVREKTQEERELPTQGWQGDSEVYAPPDLPPCCRRATLVMMVAKMKGGEAGDDDIPWL